MTTTFNIELGAGGGAFHICIPYAALEPIRDLLYRTMQGDHTEPDRRWIRMLSKQVQSAEVDLVANLANISLTLNQLLNMKIGDVLAADIPPTVTAQVDGVPRAHRRGHCCGPRRARSRRLARPVRRPTNRNDLRARRSPRDVPVR